MEAALHLNTTVLPGHKIEVTTPELPEGASVELLVYHLADVETAPSATVTSHATPPSFSVSEETNAEYEALIAIQWQRALTEEEKIRLEAVKAQISAADVNSEPYRLMKQKFEHIHQQLAAILAEVESLPDAS